MHHQIIICILHIQPSSVGFSNSSPVPSFVLLAKSKRCATLNYVKFNITVQAKHPGGQAWANPCSILKKYIILESCRAEKERQAHQTAGSIKKASASGTGNAKTIPLAGRQGSEVCRILGLRRVGYGHLLITKRRIVRHSFQRATPIRAGPVAF